MNLVTDITVLGQMVRTTRKAQGLPQAQLAATCGYGVRFIRELEQGKPSCQIAKVMHVIAMLGLELCIKGYEGEIR